MTRRSLLKTMAAFAAGGVAGFSAPRLRSSAVSMIRRPGMGGGRPATPSLALSLRAYQSNLRDSFKVSAAAPLALRELCGLNCVTGVVADPHDVVLFGEHRRTLPSLELDDLLVAVRSAYRAGDEYQTPPGCTIDPDPRAADPWRLQIARVLGMPGTAAMGRRHLEIDYELKRVSAGLTSLPTRSPLISVFDSTSSSGACDESAIPASTATTHRFWFYPRYPEDKPRFLRDHATVFIAHPIEVQLLTEEEFLEHGTRVGAAAARPAAAEFAKAMTRILSTDDVPEFVRMRADFRLIEVAKLLRFLDAPADGLEYLLSECPLDAVVPHTRFGAIRRHESGEAVCSIDLREEKSARGVVTSMQERVRRYEREFRGGVEVAVSLEAADFGQPLDGRLVDLREDILGSRPSADAISWPIAPRA